MKYIYVFLLTIIYVEVRAQKQTEKFRGANTITVVTSIPADSLFIITGKTLVDNNYTLADKDSQFKTFRVHKTVTGYDFISIILHIRIKDSAVILKGESLNSGSRNEIMYAKQKNLYGITFSEMDKLAIALNGINYYEKVKY